MAAHRHRPRRAADLRLAALAGNSHRREHHEHAARRSIGRRDSKRRWQHARSRGRRLRPAAREGFTLSLETFGTVLGLVFVAFVCTTISATIGVASLFLGHIVPAAQIGASWQAWWIGDLIGALLVAPIILVWTSPPRVQCSQNRGEAAALAAAVVAVSLVTFFGDAPGIPLLPTPFHQAALTLAILIWSALRFGQRGAVTATFCLTTVAVLATASHHGPFVVADPHTNLLSLQTSMAIVAITCLLLGAALSERRWALERAHQALSDAERANRAKTAFMNVMSHELRTPLNAISGFTQLLSSGDYGALNPKQTEALDRIQRNEKDLLAQINAVLTFVSSSREKPRSIPSPCRSPTPSTRWSRPSRRRFAASTSCCSASCRGCRCRCRPIAKAFSNSSRVSCRTRPSTRRTAASSRSEPNAWTDACASGCGTPASASRKRSSTRFSSRSSKPNAAPLANSTASVSGSRSRASSRAEWPAS